MLTFIKICGIVSIAISVAGMMYLAKSWFGLLENVLPEKKKWLYVMPYMILFASSLNEKGLQYRNRVVKGGAVFLVAMLMFLLLLNSSLEFQK